MPDDKNKKSRCLKLWQSMEKDVRALSSFKMFSVSRSCRAGHVSAGLCKDNDEECFIMDGNEEEAAREDPWVFVTDGAWKNNLLRGAVAWIRRDARGKPCRNSSAGTGG